MVTYRFKKTKLIPKIVLGMSDQQLVTGLSIKISAYSQLNCDISLYHWTMATNLAWFSSVTHLATLLFLKEYMRKNRCLWYVRVLLMTGLAVMLGVAIVPTGTSGPHAPAALPAKYTFNTEDSIPSTMKEDYIVDYMAPMIVSEVILLGGLLVRLLEMPSATWWRSGGSSLKAVLERLWRNLLVWSCQKLQSSSKVAQALFIPLVVFSLAFFISVQAILDFFRADVSGVRAVPACHIYWV